MSRSTLALLVSAAAAALALTAVWYSPLFTGTAPMRVPTITVELEGPHETPPNCDGSFSATLRVRATYPAAPGRNPFLARVTFPLETENVHRVTGLPDRVEFRTDREEAFAVRGQLHDLKRLGKVSIWGRVTLPERAGHHFPDHADTAAARITVPGLGIGLLALETGVSADSNGSFRDVDVRVGCENGDTYRLRARELRGIQAVTPDPGKPFACRAGAEHAFSLAGRKSHPGWPGSFRVTVERRPGDGGGECSLGLVQVE